MRKNIMKIFVLFILGFVLCLTACNKTPNETLEPTTGGVVEEPTNEKTTPESTITKEELENLVFEDRVCEYTGVARSIKIQNVPEGVTVRYDGNNQTEPGTYTVTATITCGDLKVVKTATLTINPLESKLEAPAEQVIVLSGKKVELEYTLNNTAQVVTYIVKKDGQTVSVNELYKYGTYEVELYAKSLKGYTESNHVTVNVKIVESQFGLSFDSEVFTWDGTEKSVLVEGELPEGYTVEYLQNKATEAGNHLAVAKVLDSENNVVETLTAVMTIENPENEEFAQFLDEFFVEYLEGDQLSVNIFCENPEDFGLERYEAVWYTYETITDEDIEHDINEFRKLLTELEVYKDARLSDLQQVAYRNIEGFLNDYIDEYSIQDSFFMRNLYIDQFGGYVADFGTYMEAYSLREKADVDDVVNYIKSTKEAFPSYLVYLEEKTQKGYSLSDFTLESMKNYLGEILGILDSEGNPLETPKDEDYYLVGILSNKIDGLEFLKDDEKEAYKAEIKKEMKDSFIYGVKQIYDGLDKYVGKLAKEDEGYLAAYENGKEYYLLQLESLLGIEDFDVEAYITELDTYFEAQNELFMGDYMTVYYAAQDEGMTMDKYLESLTIFGGTPDEMVGYLKEFAKTIVPELESDPEISIKNMDNASAKVSNAVAYYMKSAIDNTAGEHITLNPLKLEGKNDVLSTMAHEGYPGHLYAYVYSKELGLSNISTVMTSTAHGEGWATYVEAKLYEYAKENSTDSAFKAAMDYYIGNSKMGHVLETRIDVGILYEGWTVSDVASFMNDYGYNSSMAQEIYDLIIEMPSTYAAYGYGKMYFHSLHDEAKDILGNYYNEIEFNEMLLSKGWTNLGELKNTYIEYMTVKCHEVQVEFISNI